MHHLHRIYGLKKEKNVHEQMTLEPLTDYSKYKMECEKILLNLNQKTLHQ